MDSTGWCLVILVLVTIAFIALRSYNQGQAEKALAEARAAYQAALDKLRTRPTDSGLRQAALDAGRHYASLSRQNKGATVFDEVALKNDLDAATAGAVSVASPASPAPATPAAAADRLRQLDDLRAQGLITDDEYQARRAKILEGV